MLNFMVDRVLHLFKSDVGECESGKICFFFVEAGNVNEA